MFKRTFFPHQCKNIVKLCELKTSLDMKDQLQLATYLWPIAAYKISEFFKRIFGEFVTIKSSHGPITGVKMSSNLGFHYINFLGIPYAKPPTGDLRFKVSLGCKIGFINYISFGFVIGSRTSRTMGRAFPSSFRNCGLST